MAWVNLGDRGSNHDALRARDWQVHLYGDSPEILATYCANNNLNLRVFPWSRAARAAGLTANAFYLIRLGGRVGLAAPKEDVRALDHYLSRLQVRPRAQP